MSTMEYKAGVVMDLPKLLDMSTEEQQAFWSEKLPEADIEAYDDHFYVFDAHPFQVISSRQGSPPRIMLKLAHEKDYGASMVVDLDTLTQIALWMASYFGGSTTTAKVVAYDYYNGSDDPLNVGDLTPSGGQYGYNLEEDPLNILRK